MPCSFALYSVSELSDNLSAVLRLCLSGNYDRVEVVVTAHGSDGDCNISLCRIGVLGRGDLLGGGGAVADNVGGVALVAVDGYLGACLYIKGEGAVLNLGVVAAVVSDLDIRDVEALNGLVVTLRAKCDGGACLDKDGVAHREGVEVVVAAHRGDGDGSDNNGKYNEGDGDGDEGSEDDGGGD